MQLADKLREEGDFAETELANICSILKRLEVLEVSSIGSKDRWRIDTKLAAIRVKNGYIALMIDGNQRLIRD